MSLDWLVSPELAPDTTGALAPLYAAAERQALALPFCADCGQARELEQQICDRCRSTTVTWPDVELSGTVHAATMVHRHEPGLIVAEGPYPVLDVELTSGHRLVMTTVGPIDALPPIGTSVTIGFRRVGPPDRTVSVPAALIAAPARHVVPQSSGGS
jgi:uncharacterized OB-fold protein